MKAKSTLKQIAKQLVAQGKGILAADESAGTCDKRFDKYGITKTPEMRRKWRELLLTAPGIEKGLSGVILCDETLRQTTNDGVPFAKILKKRGILPGIKVDKGTVPLAGSSVEKVTDGLDGLRTRLDEYIAMSVVFTKWRGVLTVGENLPSERCIKENAFRFAEFAALSQEAGLVPIVEPEVLLEGGHSMEACEFAVGNVLRITFQSLKENKVDLSGLLLKTSMVLPGKNSGGEASPELVALSTVRILKLVVPREVAGIVFLSGGQTPEEATRNLNAIVLLGRRTKTTWPLTFSYSRALQEPVMAKWVGSEENVKEAQEIFARRVAETAAAARGEYA